MKFLSNLVVVVVPGLECMVVWLFFVSFVAAVHQLGDVHYVKYVCGRGTFGARRRETTSDPNSYFRAVIIIPPTSSECNPRTAEGHRSSPESNPEHDFHLRLAGNEYYE